MKLTHILNNTFKEIVRKRIRKRFTGILQKSEAIKICQNFLGDIWRQSEEKNFSLRQLSGGVSNTLFLASVLCDKSKRTENVIIRIFGPLLRNNRELAIKENIVFSLLSEKCIGPKFLGLLPEGRLEEYFEADPIKLTEMKDSKISHNIAAQVGKYHKLNMPLNKDGEWLYRDLQRMVNMVLSLKKEDFYNEIQQNILNYFFSVDLNKELIALKEILLSVKSPLVFCHNDLQTGNILKRRHGLESSEVQLIDFEFSNYNHRAFDIANHFCEWQFNNDADDYPGFTANENAYPSEDQQRKFIQSYLNSNKINYDKIEEDKLLVEIAAFKLASDMYWSIWGVISAVGQKECDWGYMEYAEVRLQMYFKHKKEFLNNQIK